VGASAAERDTSSRLVDNAAAEHCGSVSSPSRLRAEVPLCSVIRLIFDRRGWNGFHGSIWFSSMTVQLSRGECIGPLRTVLWR
jgi:hypothetical protein